MGMIDELISLKQDLQALIVEMRRLNDNMQYISSLNGNLTELNKNIEKVGELAGDIVTLGEVISESTDSGAGKKTKGRKKK